MHPMTRPRATPLPMPAARPACALLLFAALAGPALASSSVDGGAWALTDVVTYDQTYHYGIAPPSGGFPICTPVNCGPGHVTVPGAYLASADLDTAYGAISGAVSAIVPVPANVNELDARAFVDGQWQDHFTLVSASLPVGTPVTVLLTLKMSASTTHGATGMADPGIPRAVSGMGLGRDFLQVGLSVNPDAVDQVSTATLNFSVGADFSLTGLLQLGSQGFGNYNLQAATSQSAQASALYFVDVLTPGASYVTDSGHDYTSSAVPEVATPGMWLLGLLALARRRWVARRAEPRR